MRRCGCEPVKRAGRVVLAEHCCAALVGVLVAASLAGLYLQTLIENQAAFVSVSAPPGGVTPSSVPGASAGDLFHIVHLSDTHLSSLGGHSQEYFDEFCADYLPAVAPAFVVHTGDITDARVAKRPFLRGKEVEAEWEAYRATLTAAGWWDTKLWIDMRGNHDGIQVEASTSPNNYYNTYGVYGPGKAASDLVYSFTYTSPANRTLRLVVVDQVPYPGLSVPFNIQGDMPASAVDAVDAALTAAAADLSVDNVIVAAHFPAAFMEDQRLAGVIATHTVDAYLCGHAHEHKMWSWLHHGDRPYLELEADDMFGSRGYRILAYDHGLFSFSDHHMGDWPIIHITNPKPAAMLLDSEAAYLLPASTHIRVLVFTKAQSGPIDVSKLMVTIDGVTVCDGMTAAGDYTGLHTCPWDTASLSSGLHNLRVDYGDQHQTVEFSVDGTGGHLGTTLFQAVQRASTLAVYYGVFVTAMVMLFVLGLGVAQWRVRRWPRATLDAWQSRIQAMRFVEASWHSTAALRLLEEVEQPRLRSDDVSGWSRAWLYATWQYERSLWRLSLLPKRTAACMAGIGLWLAVGPWTLGPIMPDSKWGVGFVWGMVFEGGYAAIYEFAFWVGLSVCAWTAPLLAFVALPAESLPVRALLSKPTATAAPAPDASRPRSAASGSIGADSTGDTLSPLDPRRAPASAAVPLAAARAPLAAPAAPRAGVPVLGTHSSSDEGTIQTQTTFRSAMTGASSFHSNVTSFMSTFTDAVPDPAELAAFTIRDAVFAARTHLGVLRAAATNRPRETTVVERDRVVECLAQLAARRSEFWSYASLQSGARADDGSYMPLWLVPHELRLRVAEEVEAQRVAGRRAAGGDVPADTDVGAGTGAGAGAGAGVGVGGGAGYEPGMGLDSVVVAVENGDGAAAGSSAVELRPASGPTAAEAGTATPSVVVEAADAPVEAADAAVEAADAPMEAADAPVEAVDAPAPGEAPVCPEATAVDDMPVASEPVTPSVSTSAPVDDGRDPVATAASVAALADTASGSTPVVADAGSALAPEDEDSSAGLTEAHATVGASDVDSGPEGDGPLSVAEGTIGGPAAAGIDAPPRPAGGAFISAVSRSRPPPVHMGVVDILPDVMVSGDMDDDDDDLPTAERQRLELTTYYRLLLRAASRVPPAREARFLAHAQQSVPRTLRDALTDVHRGRMSELLRAFACRRPDVGYTQGVNPIAAMVVLTIDDQPMAFAVLCHIVERVIGARHFDQMLSELRVDLRAAETVVSMVMPPEMTRLLVPRGDKPAPVRIAWLGTVLFMTALVGQVPHEAALDAFDLAFLIGPIDGGACLLHGGLLAFLVSVHGPVQSMASVTEANECFASHLLLWRKQCTSEELQTAILTTCCEHVDTIFQARVRGEVAVEASIHSERSRRIPSTRNRLFLPPHPATQTAYGIFLVVLCFLAQFYFMMTYIDSLGVVPALLSPVALPNLIITWILIVQAWRRDKADHAMYCLNAKRDLTTVAVERSSAACTWRRLCWRLASDGCHDRRPSAACGRSRRRARSASSSV